MNYVKKIPRGSGDDLPSLPKQFPDLHLKKITILINNLNLITDHSLMESPRRKLRSSQIFPRKHSVVLGNIDPVPEETRSGILPACRCLGAIYLVRTKLSMAVVRRRHVLSQ